MNKDQFQGAVQDAAGKAQQTLGMATGSGERRLEGVSREMAGKGQHAYGDLRDMANDVSESASDLYDRASQTFDRSSRTLARNAHAVEKRVEQNPMTSLLIAAGAGYLLGLLIHGRT